MSEGRLADPAGWTLVAGVLALVAACVVVRANICQRQRRIERERREQQALAYEQQAQAAPDPTTRALWLHMAHCTRRSCRPTARGSHHQRPDRT